MGVRIDGATAAREEITHKLQAFVSAS
jgi:hypothetical protein